jgi:mono/diheme cytochrome c family protein
MAFWLSFSRASLRDLVRKRVIGMTGKAFRTQVDGSAWRRDRARHADGGPRACALLAGALVLVACAAALPEPTAADLALARADDPDVALADLERGRAVYGKRCGSCHALRSPAERPPEAWPVEVTRMQTAHAVRLTTDEERDIVRYLRAASALGRQPNPSK